MQTVPGYTNSGDILEPDALITIDGVAYDMDSIKSVSVTRELSSSLPPAVTSASGWTAATADMTWDFGDDVEERVNHPWDGTAFPPKPAQSATVDMGYRGALARQLTGVVEKSSGNSRSRNVNTALLDHWAKLDRPISFPPHLNVMPPWEEGGAFLPVNNTPTFTTDRVLRACGFNATPPMDPGCILSVPLMGSAWPERGRVDSASQQGFPSFPPSFNASQWGVACNSIEATYTPDTSNWPTSRLDKTLQMTVKVRNVSASSGNSFLRTRWGTPYITLLITADRRVLAQIYNGTTTVTVCSLTAADAWSADVFVLRVNPAGTFAIYANNGVNSTGTTTLPTAMTSGNITDVRVSTPHITGQHIGGVQVGFSTSQTWLHKTTAVLTPPAAPSGLPLMRRIDNRIALDVLKEQAEAESASHWIDEQGVYRWINRDYAAAQTPVTTLTPKELIEVGWESDASSVRSRVEIVSDEWAINRSPVSNQVAWQASGTSLDSGQTIIEFAEPEADVEWFGVDEALKLLRTTTWWPEKFNWGHGSWFGGVDVSDTTERWSVRADTGFDATLEKVGLFTYKITTYAGTPGSSWTVDLRTISKDFESTVRSSKRDFDLSILRCKVRAQATKMVNTSVFTGPPNAAVLEHNVGSWIQDPDARQRYANWLGMQITEPRPVLSGLGIIPNHLLQLGDVVWVDDPDNMRIRLKVFITGYTQSIGAGSAALSISGNILEVFSYVTNERLDTHASSYTNAAFDTLWAGRSNAQLDADPLERG